MDAIAPTAPISEFGLITRVLNWVSGVDGDTLSECPPYDVDAVRAIGILLLAVCLYQTSLLALVAHRLFAADGALHVDLVLGSFFIAAQIMLLDSYVFVRAGFHAEGVQALAAAGLDLSGGLTAKLKAGIFLSLRILLAFCFALLTALFVSLILYRADIAADLDHQFQQQNAAVIAAARDRVDAEIRQATNAEQAAQQRVDATQKQVTTMLAYLRSPAVWRDRERAQQGQAALQELQHDLQAATSELDAQRQELSKRINGRDEAIQRAVGKSLDQVAQDAGILAQLTALRRIAADPEIALVILLIDLTSFGLELAAVLAKVTTTIPTTYAVLLARNAYMRVSAIVDEIDEMTRKREHVAHDAPSPAPAGDRKSPYEEPLFAAAGAQQDTPPPKRPRGRPRKNGLNGGSPSPAGNDNRHSDKNDERH